MKATVCSVLRDPAYAKKDRLEVLIWALVNITVIVILHGTALGRATHAALASGRSLLVSSVYPVPVAVMGVIVVLLIMLQMCMPILYFFGTERLAPLREMPIWRVALILVALTFMSLLGLSLIIF